MPKNKIVLKEKYLTTWDSATSILQMQTYLANEVMILVAVQLLSCVWLCNSMTAAQQVSLSSTIPQSLLKLMSIKSGMPSNHLILCCPLLLLLSVFSSIKVFPVSQLFISSGQNNGASASVLAMNIQNWIPLGWTGLSSLQSKGLSRIFSNTTV